MDRYDKERGKEEESYMDWQIAATKAVFCLREYRETKDVAWLDLVEVHLAASNGFLQELDRISPNIPDPIHYLGADRCNAECRILSTDRSGVVLGRL